MRRGSQGRQGSAEPPVLDSVIQSRKHLFDLQKWVRELHKSWAFREISRHTWRGPEKFGYWQQIADGGHLRPKPVIRPRWQDWHDIRIMLLTMRRYKDASRDLFDAAMEVVRTRAELDGAVARLVEKARKNGGTKEISLKEK